MKRNLTLAMFIAAAVLCACGGGGGGGGGSVGTTSVPTPAPTAPPWPIVFMQGTNQVLKLQLVGTGAQYEQQVYIGQTGYAGTFTASSADCTNVATYAVGAGGQLTITGSGAGSCTVTVTNSFAQTGSLPVSVTVSGVVVQ